MPWELRYDDSRGLEEVKRKLKYQSGMLQKAKLMSWFCYKPTPVTSVKSFRSYFSNTFFVPLITHVDRLVGFGESLCLVF